MALSHTLWWLMLLADTVNLCVQAMGVSSFWQTAAQQTFLSNFESTLHLLWPPSETLWKLLKLLNFNSLFTAWSPWASTGLYTHIFHINCTFFCLFTTPPPFSLPSPVPSASTAPTSPPPPFIVLLPLLHYSLKSLSCVEGPPSSFRNRMTLLPFIKLAYGRDTTQASKWEEKKGKVMWEERKGNFPSTPEAHLRPSLKHGLLLLPFVSSPRVFLKAPSLSIKENFGKGRRLRASKIPRLWGASLEKRVLAMSEVQY